MGEERIMGGFFLLARKFLSHELWIEKPPSWTKIWLYIIGKVNWEDNGKYLKGHGYFNFEKELKAIGPDITINNVYCFLKYARKEQMVSTVRSTRGMRVNVLNYIRFQDMQNYFNTFLGESDTGQTQVRSESISKRSKEVKKEYIQEVFNYFVVTTGRPSTFRFNSVRERWIRKRLKEGRTIEELKKAITNFSKDSYFKQRKSQHIDLLYAIGIQPNLGVDHLDKWLEVEVKKAGVDVRIERSNKERLERRRIVDGKIVYD